jgi:hypothetical protein
MLASSTLVLEALVAFFAMLVAVNLSDVDSRVAVGVAAAVSLLCLLTAGLLRARWAYVLGSVLQVALIALGFAVPAMFFLGALFAALWIVALLLGAKADRFQREHQPDPG